MVNGHQTKSRGVVRHFRSINLDKTEVYTFRVQVKCSVEGEEVTDETTILMRSGSEHELDFRPAFASEEIQEEQSADQEQDLADTVVRLHVPPGSIVSLAGNTMKGDGELRTFNTVSLKQGEVSPNYVIRVEMEVDGQTRAHERVVSIVGGTEVDYHFQFESDRLASR